MVILHWAWLLVAFVIGTWVGMFLTALIKANNSDFWEDEEEVTRERVERKWIVNPDETLDRAKELISEEVNCVWEYKGDVMICRNKAGEILRIDRYGIAIYDPESGFWKSLN